MTTVFFVCFGCFVFLAEAIATTRDPSEGLDDRERDLTLQLVLPVQVTGTLTVVPAAVAENPCGQLGVAAPTTGLTMALVGMRWQMSRASPRGDRLRSASCRAPILSSFDQRRAGCCFRARLGRSGS
jgi:hypothetical protein